VTVEIANQLGLAGPTSRRVEVIASESSPEVAFSESEPIRPAYCTPEFMEFWRAYCKSLMENPPRSGGT